jgi:hypothetical protein
VSGECTHLLETSLEFAQSVTGILQVADAKFADQKEALLGKKEDLEKESGTEKELGQGKELRKEGLAKEGSDGSEIRPEPTGAVALAIVAGAEKGERGEPGNQNEKLKEESDSEDAAASRNSAAETPGSAEKRTETPEEKGTQDKSGEEEKEREHDDQKAHDEEELERREMVRSMLAQAGRLTSKDEILTRLGQKLGIAEDKMLECNQYCGACLDLGPFEVGEGGAKLAAKCHDNCPKCLMYQPGEDYGTHLNYQLDQVADEFRMSKKEVAKLISKIDEQELSVAGLSVASLLLPGGSSSSESSDSAATGGVSAETADSVEVEPVADEFPDFYGPMDDDVPGVGDILQIHTATAEDCRNICMLWHKNYNV